MSAVTVPRQRGRRPGAGPLRRVLGRHPIGYLFVAPYVIYLALVYAYPLGFAVWMSFHDYFFAAPGATVDRPWVGLDNYTNALSDPLFRRAIVNVGIFLLISVPLTVVLSLVLATALNAKLSFRGFFRAAYYIPYLTASVAVIAVWLWLFSQDGLVNQMLGGLAPSPSWLVNSDWAMPIIALHVTWKQLGFYVLLYLAALQNIPGELYEAAELDGANVWQRLRHVTIPQTRFVLLVMLLMQIVATMQVFTEPYVMTGGGPEDSTVTVLLLLYRYAFTYNDFGTASAMSLLLFVFLGGFSALYLKLTKSGG
jgi:multiple sugar transport system permease protein